MKRFKFTLVMLAAVAMLSMSLNAPRWTCERAEKWRRRQCLPDCLSNHKEG
jgi:hypothetical protein